MGVLIEVNCETDFVARNDEFRTFVRDLCLQIAAASPLFVSRDQVPEAMLFTEREIAERDLVGAQAAKNGVEQHGAGHHQIGAPRIEAG